MQKWEYLIIYNFRNKFYVITDDVEYLSDAEYQKIDPKGKRIEHA